MSEKENGLAGWQKAIQEISNYEPTDKYVVAVHRIKQLEQELAEAKKDQARYQWLRNEVLVDGENNDSLYVACDSDKYTGRWALVGDELDQAIDAAIKEQQ